MFLNKTIIIFMFASSAAYGGKLNFDTRIDAQSQTYNEDARAAGFGATNFKYYLKLARLDFQSNLNEKTSFRSRLVYNVNQGNVQKRDSLNGSVDLFFINYKFSDPLDFTLGKFSSEMGSFEHQYSGGDLYLQSAANVGVPVELNTVTKSIFATRTGKTIAGTWTWANSGIVKFYTGAKLNYKFSDQELALHSANLSDDDTTTTNGNSNLSQTRTLAGLVYKGTFNEKTYQPILSYHQASIPGAPSASTDAKAIYTGAGLKVNCAQHIFDIEYLNNSFQDRTLLSNAVVTNDNIRSILWGWTMQVDQFTSKIKLESSEITAAEEKIFDLTSYSLGLEWKPVKEDNFRLHVAYANKSYKPTDGNTEILQEVLFGTRINADFLK